MGVARNQFVEIFLTGYDVDGDALKATITSLPTSGKLYQLSRVYNDYGYDPKYELKDEIVNTNTLVTSSRNRVIYVPPANTVEPNGQWDMFKYYVHDGSTGSAEGYVQVVSSSLVQAGSNFNLGNDGWTIVNNGNKGVGVTHEQSSHGMLNYFIYSTDDELDIDSFAGDDSTLWYFNAPLKYLGFQAFAYGGTLDFTIGAFSGDLDSASSLNSIREIVVLECSSCALGTGMRFVMRNQDFDGVPKTFSLQLLETAGWLKDPKNTLATWSAPTQCEMVEMLHNLSAFRILGDFTKWYESVGIDNVAFKAKGTGFQNTLPISCLCANPGTQC